MSSFMMFMGGVVTMAALLISIANTHETIWGSCPEVTPMEDFEITKFKGIWYVIELFQNDIYCMIWNISETNNPDIWHIDERLSSGSKSSIGQYRQDTRTTAELKILSQKNPGKMSVNWASNIAGSYDFTVYTTDYTSYAGIWSCQQVTFLQRQQGIILSREPLPRPGVRQIAAGRLVTYKIEMSYFKRVGQSMCEGYKYSTPSLVDEMEKWGTFSWDRESPDNQTLHLGASE